MNFESSFPLIFILTQPIPNSFARMRFVFIAWDDMKMCVKYMLSANRATIPAKVVPIGMICLIQYGFCLMDDIVEGGPLRCGEVKDGFTMRARNDQARTY